MKILKLIGRVLLILLMIPAVPQVAVITIALVKTARQNAEGFSYVAGQFVGALSVLIVLLWLFRKLGNEGAEKPCPDRFTPRRRSARCAFRSAPPA